jgi:hypothetical protein
MGGGTKTTEGAPGGREKVKVPRHAFGAEFLGWDKQAMYMYLVMCLRKCMYSALYKRLRNPPHADAGQGQAGRGD